MGLVLLGTVIAGFVPSVFSRPGGIASVPVLPTGILIMDPAVARLVFTLGAPPPAILLLELGFFVALIGYDIRTRRRPHWASMLGLGLFAVAMLAKLLVAQQPWWAEFVYGVFG